MDEYDEIKNKDNRELTLRLAGKNGLRISLQTHKVWGVD
jgi:organic radical activating enzyme